MLPEPRTTRVPQGTIAWREAGEGPPLVFLHGIGANSSSWSAQIEHFSTRFRVIAWDAPGYGGSDPLREESPSAENYADALSQMFERTGVRSCRLVGQSLGAIMAVAYARKYVGRTRGLVLTAAATGYGKESAASRAAKIQDRLEPLTRLGPAAFAAERASRLLGPHASTAALAKVRAAMAEIRPDGYAQATRMLAGANILGDAPAVRAPTLVVCGEADAVTPPETNRKIASLIKGAKFVPLPGLGHACYADNPVMFNTALDAFLATLPEPVA